MKYKVHRGYEVHRHDGAYYVLYPRENAVSYPVLGIAGAFRLQREAFAWINNDAEILQDGGWHYFRSDVVAGNAKVFRWKPNLSEDEIKAIREQT